MSSSRKDAAAAFRGTMAGMPTGKRGERSPPARRRDALLRPGTIIDGRKGYEIVELLGEGGMGRVYKAYDSGLDRYVALKVMKANVPEQERERFWREAKLAACFSHPNLSRVLDAGFLPDGDARWMAIEYLRGQDVGKLLETQGRLAPRILVDVLAQALNGLAYVHERKIIHCDMKPENVFVTRDPLDRSIPVVKVIDFGIHRDGRGPVVLRRRLSGDPRYMSPEQAVVNGFIDGRADLYAVGLMTFELATGAHPFVDLFAEPLDTILAAQQSRDPAPPSTLLPASIARPYAQALDALVAKATHKDPDQRFADAEQMKRAVIRLGQVAQLRVAA